MVVKLGESGKIKFCICDLYNLYNWKQKKIKGVDIIRKTFLEFLLWLIGNKKPD